MSAPIISNRDQWDAFITSATAKQPTSSLAYRTQNAALAVFNQPKPDFVEAGEFAALKARCEQSLENSKKALIDEFMNTIQGLGAEDLNRSEIEQGKLNLSEKIRSLDAAKKEHVLKAVAKLEFLTKLDLSRNQIVTIPPELANLSQLRWLDLSRNQIITIPPELGNLSQLRELYLDSNQITTIPPELANLSQLETLYLHNNQITTIPSELGNLSQLEWLYLQNNQITTIPTELGNLSQLRTLNLAHNQITTIPPELGNLSQLRMPSLDHNLNLRELPLSLGSIPGITDLAISGTQIPWAMRDAILASCQQRRGAQATVNLPQKLQLWATYAQLTEEKKEALQNLNLNEQEIIAVHEWLVRLERSKDFRYAQGPLSKKACEMLLGLKDPTWKELFFAQVGANLEHCEDRGSMAFNEIYTAWALHSLPADAPLQQKLELLTGVAKTVTLRNELAKRIGDVAESVEIYLYYEIQMKERFKLVTAIEQMAYSAMGKRDNINEDELATAVEAAYVSELIEIPAFQTLVNGDPAYQKLFAAQNQALEDKMGALDDKKEEMSSEEYASESRKLQEEYNQLRCDVAKAWLAEKLNPRGRQL